MKDKWKLDICTNTQEPTIVERDPSFLETIDNSIYFYSSIDSDRILQLVKTLRTLSIDLKNKFDLLRISEQPNVYLHLYSYGGSVHAGFAGMDAILTSQVPVNTVIDGACASAATLLSVVGKKRYMHKHSIILIHQVSTIFWGKYAEFEDEKKNLDMYMKKLVDIYSKYTTIPGKTLKEILSRDLWFEAKDALKYKLVDEIIDEI